MNIDNITPELLKCLDGYGSKLYFQFDRNILFKIHVVGEMMSKSKCSAFNSDLKELGFASN